MNKETHQGVLQILLSGVFYAFMGIFIKTALAAAPVSSGELLALRFVVATLILWLIQSFRREAWPSRQSLQSIFILGAVFFMLNASLYFEAMRLLPASLAVLILYTNPLWISLGSPLLLGESISSKIWMSLPIAIIGLLLLVGTSSFHLNFWGILFALGASLVYSGFVLLSGRWLKNDRGLLPITLLHTSVAISAVAIHIRHPLKFLDFHLNFWIPLLALATISTILPLILFMSGIRKIKKSDAAVLSISEPVSGVFLAAAFLGERLSSLQLLGGFLILLVLIFVSTSYFDRKKKSLPAG